MQQVFTVWDDGMARDGNPYRLVNAALERGANAVLITASAPTQANGP